MLFVVPFENLGASWSQLKSRIALLADDHGQFQAGELKALYKRKFKEDLPCEELKFRNVKALL